MMYDESRIQAAIAAGSREAASHSDDIKSQEDAEAFVQALCELAGTTPVSVRVITPEEAEGLGHGLADSIDGVIPSQALVIEGRREIFVVDAGQNPLARGLLLFHEFTHIVCPTDPAHEPVFVRAWLDLCRRSGLYSLIADAFLEPRSVLRASESLTNLRLSRRGT